MPAHAGTLTFSSIPDLAECIRGCEYIDNARRILSMDPTCKDPLEICNDVVLTLCERYVTDDTTTVNALMICNSFMSTKRANLHLTEDAPVKFFWTCVGVVCFTLAQKIHLGNPLLKNMLKIVRIRDSDYSRKYYLALQIHVLTAINWKLFFPSGDEL